MEFQENDNIHISNREIFRLFSFNVGILIYSTHMSK